MDGMQQSSAFKHKIQLWEDMTEILDNDFTGEEKEALNKIKARYRKNFGTKDLEKVREREVQRDFFADLPEHIIFDILVKVPANYLYKNARLVCRAWRDIISTDGFMAQNFTETKADLLIEKPTSFKNQYFNVKLIEIEEMLLDHKVHDFGLHRIGLVRSSCNGLVLINVPKEEGLLQVVNSATMVGLTLPKCSSGCPHKACGSALGFDHNSKVYKVVHIYADAFGFEVLNLSCSSSSWKQIPGPWEDLLERPFNFENFSWSDPIVVNGSVLHWYVESHKYIISMDVSEEVSTRTYLPNIGEEIRKDRYNLVDLGGFLSFVYTLSDDQLDVWTLEDVKGQVWSKKHSIIAEIVDYMTPQRSLPSSNFSNALPTLSKLVPVAGLSDGKILIFNHESSGVIYIYDIKRRTMKKLKMTSKKPTQFMAHKSSLFHWRTPNDS